jgi:tetratricopeptide (TPR) repeat protein
MSQTLLAAVVLSTVTLLAAPATAAPASQPASAAADEPAAGPWDRSLGFERAGRLDDARAVLVTAYGAAPESYEVALRLAWLDLKQRRVPDAIQRYRRARALEGAGSEATRGLVDALTLDGYRLLDGGYRREARAVFTEAAGLDPQAADARTGLRLAAPPPVFGAEGWLGGFTASLARVRTLGLTASVEADYRPHEDVRLRLAYRHVETRTRGPGSGGGGQGSGGLVGRQEEVYASAAFARRLVGVEAAGLAIVPADTDAVFGGGLSARLGFRWGGALDASVLKLADGRHWQLTPTAFYWPTAWLGFAAGARVTLDPVGKDASARLGATLRRGPVTLLLQAHYGGERWPFELGAFTVTSLAATLKFGGNLTALLRVSRSVDLGLQLQAEGLAGGSERGAYYSVGLGVRWSLGRADAAVASPSR